MKIYFLIASIILALLFSCESPHEKSTRRHLNNIVVGLEQIAINYDDFRDGETELRLAKINQFYTDNLKQLDLLKEEKASVHPSKKFTAVSNVTDSLLSYSITYFQNRKEMILLVEDMKTTIKLFHQSKAEYDEHVNALKVSSSWANHHRTMIDFESKKMKERKDKTQMLTDQIKTYNDRIQSIQAAFFEAEKSFLAENETLKISQTINIASRLFEKENPTESLITQYVTQSTDELLMKPIENSQLTSN